MSLFDCSAKTRSLYIHWPFCPYRCHFCPFVAMAGQDQFMQQYHNALKKEILAFVASCPEKIELDTIYFGGGTPSTYPNELLLDTFGILKDAFMFSKNIEITIEVNPGTIKPGQLAFFQSVGINRMSVGIQSLNDEILRGLNRHQKASDVYALLNKAFEFVPNVSVDVILGLPGVSAYEWRALLKKLISWPIKHLSLYMLEVHENTQLFFKVKSKTLVLPPDDALVEQYFWSQDFLQRNGFEQYEVSSFAKPGFHSRHNTVYWERKPYKAFGLGACSFDGAKRMQNEKNLMQYMKNSETSNWQEPFCEVLTNQQVRIENIMLGLRRVTGVSYEQVMQGLSDEEKQRREEIIFQLEQRSLLKKDGDRLLLLPHDLALENEIITQLS